MEICAIILLFGIVLTYGGWLFFPSYMERISVQSTKENPSPRPTIFGFIVAGIPTVVVSLRALGVI